MGITKNGKTKTWFCLVILFLVVSLTTSFLFVADKKDNKLIAEGVEFEENIEVSELTVLEDDNNLIDVSGVTNNDFSSWSVSDKTFSAFNTNSYGPKMKSSETPVAQTENKFENLECTDASNLVHTYRGTQITPTLKVTLKGATTPELKEGEDYEVSYGENINCIAGNTTEGEITITGLNTYAGSFKIFRFDIQPLDLSQISFNPESFSYHCGEKIEPFVKLTINNFPLYAGTYEGKPTEQQFKVVYENNINVGTATYYCSPLEGNQNLTGQATGIFTIEPINLSDIFISGVIGTSEATYCNKVFIWDVDLKITYSDGNHQTTRIVPESDYKIEYKRDNTTISQSEVKNAGEYYCYYVPIKNSSGTFNLKITEGKELYGLININKADISHLTATIADETPLTYTGLHKARQVESVKMTFLYKNTDGTQTQEITPMTEGEGLDQYQVWYRKDGIDTKQAIDAGNYQIVIKSNNFEDFALTKDGQAIGFTIQKRNIDNLYDFDFSMIVPPDGYIYTGSGIQPKASITQVNEPKLLLVENVDYTLAYDDNINVSTSEIKAKMKITFTKNYANANGQEIVKTFSVLPRDIGNTSDTNIEVLKVSNVYYTGEIQKKAPEIKFFGNDLSTDEYTLRYLRDGGETQDFINKGIISIQIYGKNNFKGSRIINYEIMQQNLADQDVVITIKKGENTTYTGSLIAPQILVTYNDMELKETDYTITGYSTAGRDGINVASGGVVVIQAVSDGNYFNKKEFEFDILARSLNDCKLGEIAPTTYTGQPQEPTILLKFKEMDLQKTTDFTLNCENNENAGTASVTIRGEGNYKDRLDKTWQITSFEVNGTMLTVESDILVYNAQPQLPNVTISTDFSTLKKGTDFDIVASRIDGKEPKDVGSLTFVITTRGNYSGELTGNFSITERTITGSGVTFSEILEKGYTGNPITISGDDVVITSDCGEILKIGVDYKITGYENNIEKTTDKLAIVSILGIGNYEGTNQTTFKIGRAVIASVTLSVQSEIEYSKTPHKATVTQVMSSSGEVDVSACGVKYYRDYNIETHTGTETDKFTDVGTITVVVSVLESSTEYQGTVITNYKIVPKEITSDMISGINASYEYQVSQITPVPVITWTKWDGENDYNLISGTEYSVNYGENKNVSTGGSISIEGVGNYTGTHTINFEITPLDIGKTNANLVFNSIQNKTYNGNTQDLTSTDLENIASFYDAKLVSGTDFLVEYVDAGRKNAGTYNFNLNGQRNYTGTKALNYTIDQKLITESDVVILPISDQTFTNEDIEVVPKVTDETTGDDIEVVFSYENNRNVTWQGDSVVSGAKAIISQIINQNYKLGAEEKSVFFKITPKSINDTDVSIKGVSTIYPYKGNDIKPTPSLVWDRSGTIVTLTIPADYSVKYYRDYDSENLTETTDFGSVGKITIVITSKEHWNYVETRIFAYQIISSDLDEAVITFIDSETPTYNGKEQKPRLKIVIDSFTLVQDFDYELLYTDNIDAGLARIEIKGLGTFEEVREETFNILQKSSQNLNLTGIDPTYMFSGTDIKPPLEILDDEITFDGVSKLLVDSDDYDINYYRDGSITSDFTSVGNITLEISFKKNYSGQKSVSYEITQKALSEDIINTISDQTYTGKLLTPEVYVFYNNIKFDINDLNKLSIEFFNNLEVTFDENNQVIAGASVKISSTGGNFSGNVTIKFKINRQLVENLNNFNCSIDGYPINGYTYTGKYFEPSITLTPKTLSVLNEGVDYSLTYENNKNYSTETTKGAINITFTKNYQGTVVKNFEINQASVHSLDFEPFSEITYDRHTHKESLILYIGEDVLSTDEYDFGYYRNYNPDLANQKETTDFTSAGRITIKVVGKGNISGERYDISYEIKQKSLSELQMSFTEENNFHYSGAKFEPKIEVVFDGLALLEEQDFTITYGNNARDNINVPKGGVVIIKGVEGGNYGGSQKLEFEIEAKEITDDMVAEIKPVGYNGKMQEPELEITYNGMKLVRYYDYNATFTNNLNKGTASVKIDGIGNYVGTYNTTFEISGRILSDSTIKIVWNVSNLTYTGSGVRPDFDLYHNNDTQDTADDIRLIPVNDYTFEFSNNINHTNEAKLSVVGVTNYAGSVEYTFTIKQKQISDADVLFSSISDQTYTGSAIEPELKIVYNGRQLKQTEDYNIRYSNNIYAGSAVVIVSGKNNFAGQKTLSFEITVKNIDRLELSSEKEEYDGTLKLPTIKVYAGSTLLKLSDYQIKYYRNYEDEENTGNQIDIEDFIDAGIITIIAKAQNNFNGTLTAVFEIARKKISDADIEIIGIEDKVYTGSGITQDVQILFGGKELVLEKDYNLIYRNNLTAGVASVDINAVGNFDGTRTEKFTINKIDPVVNPSVPNRKYFAGDSVPNLILKDNDTIGIIGIKNQKYLAEGLHSYEWEFVPVDTQNCNGKTGMIEIYAEKVVVEYLTFDGDSKIYYAYDNFNANDFSIKAIYNNKKEIDINSTDCTFKVGNNLVSDGYHLNVDDKIDVYSNSSFWTDALQLPITILPLEISVVFKNKTLIENGNLQTVGYDIIGEVEGCSAQINIRYFKDDVETTGIRESGKYTVIAEPANKNYVIDEEANEAVITVKKSKVVSLDGRVIVYSEQGFDDDVQIEMIEVENGEKDKILEGFTYTPEKVYKILMYKGENKDAFVPTGKITLEISIDPELLSNGSFALYHKGVDGNFRRVIFEDKADLIKIEEASLGTYVISISGTTIKIQSWIYLLFIGLLLLMVLFISITILQKRRRKIRKAKMLEQSRNNLD